MPEPPDMLKCNPELAQEFIMRYVGEGLGWPGDAAPSLSKR